MANCPKNHSKLVTRFFSTLCCTKVAGGDQEMTCTYFDGSMNHQNEVGPSSMRNFFADVASRPPYQYISIHHSMKCLGLTFHPTVDRDALI